MLLTQSRDEGAENLALMISALLDDIEGGGEQPESTATVLIFF